MGMSGFIVRMKRDSESSGRDGDVCVLCICVA